MSPSESLGRVSGQRRVAIAASQLAWLDAPTRGADDRKLDAAGLDPSAGLLEVGSAADGPWVRTTDLARIDPDGFLWILGRTDDAILRGGFKVFPGEIAAALRAHPAVRECGVTGIPDERLGAVPVAAVELVEGATATSDELMAYAREHLTSYQVPREILVVPALPRTPSMKVSAPGVASLFAAADGDGS